MNKFRGIVAKVLVVLMFGLLIVSFAVWGIGDMLRQRAPNAVVATVGDAEVTVPEFREAYTLTFRQQQRTYGPQFTQEMATAMGLPQQVVQQLILTKTFQEQAADLGLVVTDEQVRTAIFRTPTFQDSLGKFDRQRFEQFLRTSGLSEGRFIELVRRDIARQRLTAPLAGAADAPDVLVEALRRYDAETRTASYFTVPQTSVEVPAPTDEQLGDYYENNKNRYLAPEYRTVSFLTIDPERLAAEVHVDDAALRKAYEDALPDLRQPEQRTLRQIVYPDQAAAQAAKERLQAGESFDALADADHQIVDLGQTTREGVLPGLADAAFSGESGSVVGPVETPFGWHLVQIESVTPAAEPTFEEAADQLRTDMKRRQAIDAAVNLANEVDDAMAGGATVEEAAQSLGLPLQTIANVDREGENVDGVAVTGLPAPDVFLKTAFETAQDSDSLLTEMPGGGYFLLHVDTVTPAAPKPLDEVRDQVVANWQAEERSRLAYEQAEALAKKVQDGATLESVAEEAGQAVQQTDQLQRTATAPSPNLVGGLFGAKQGEVVVSDGPDGPIVAKLTAIDVPAAPAEADANGTLKKQIASGLSQDVITAYADALERGYGVSVNQQQLQEAQPTAY